MTKKEWYLAKELVGLSGMPTSLSSVSRKAANEKWEKRQIDGVKGITFEYHVKSLPKPTQEALQGKLPAISEGAIKIPFYDIYASAGHGITPLDDDNSPYNIDIHPQILIDQGISPINLFSMTVKGDSMERSLFDGDIAILKRVFPPLLLLEGIYLLRIGQELFIKRILFNKFEESLHVDSDNDEYRSFTINGEDLNHVEIYGEWVGTLSRARRVTSSKQPSHDKASDL